MNSHLHFVTLALCTALAGNIATHAFAREQFGVTFQYQEYQQVLATYVDDSGMVDYAGLKANRTPLDHFVRDISGLYIDLYDGWSEPEQLAFWVNAYNALTLRAIIDHYPIKPNWKTRFLFPNGIRQIPGVWDDKSFNVKASDMSLNEIEHEVIRKQYTEPRVHMALVCAAMGCPPLRNEPYEAGKLDEQLSDQTRRFLANPAKFKIDAENGKVMLSSIFEWFEEDFVRAFGDEPSVNWGSKGQQAVMAFIGKYLDEEQWALLKKGTFEVEYLDYDWSLNEQASK